MVASALALPFGDADKVALRDFWFTLWLVVVCFAYLGACWHNLGMTVGMRAWQVRLVDKLHTERRNTVSATIINTAEGNAAPIDAGNA